MRRSLVLIALLVSGLMFVTGCGDPKADGSSEEAFKKSISDMEKGMDEPKKEKLEKAVQTLMMKNVLFAKGDVDTMKKHIKETFDGKTADQLIADGEKADAENKAEIQKMINGK